MDPPAMLLDDLSHSLEHTVNSAGRMVQAVTVLHVRQNREGARTFPRRHPQILGLKREREPQPLVIEITGQPVVHSVCSVQLGQRVEHISLT